MRFRQKRESGSRQGLWRRDSERLVLNESFDASALARPDEVRAMLIAAAQTRSALTYAELLGMLGYAFSRPKMRSLCRVLDAVDADCAARGEPELAVLVVRQSDGLPGQGWWVNGGAREHGHAGSWEGPEAAALIARVQASAFDHWAAREE